MADLSLHDVLKFRRAAIVPQSVLSAETTVPIADSSIRVTSATAPPPPPPIPPRPKGKDVMKGNPGKGSHSKFDLRPSEMKVGPDPEGRPTPRAIGFADTQHFDQLIDKETLINVMSKLRKVNKNESSPPPHEPDCEHCINASIRNCGCRIDDNLPSEEVIVLNNQTHIPIRMKALPVEQDLPPQYKTDQNFISELLKEIKTTPQLGKLLQELGKPTSTKFDGMVFDPNEAISDEDWIKRIHNWRTSIEDDRMPTNEEIKISVPPKAKPNEVDAISNGSKTEASCVDEVATKSSISQGKSRTRTSRTRSRRASSVCFSFPDGDEGLSEISKDDLADVHKRNAKPGSYDFICDELEIREPFKDNELNVLHALCIEYATIAELTYSKRTFLVKSLPHHHRVYNYLRSNAKSEWLEKGDVARGRNNSKALEFIFSVILRRKSRKINGYTLNLSGFKEGRTLTPERFSRIMSDAFKRRNYLFKCAVGLLEEFSSLM
jgi:hypothetical protein